MISKLPDEFEFQLQSIVKRTKQHDFESYLEELDLKRLCSENLDDEQMRYQILVSLILFGQTTFEKLKLLMVRI